MEHLVRRWATAAAFFTLIAPVLIRPVAAQQLPAIQGVFENYFLSESTAQHQDSKLATSYLSATGQVSRSLAVTAGAVTYDGETILDENCVRANGLGGQWRLGRFRTAFGHSDWSELYYNGLARRPLMRNGYYDSWYGISLDRIDTGVDYMTNAGSWQLQLAAIDPYSGGYQLTPNKLDHVAARAQTYVGGWILGFNVLASTRSNSQDYGSAKVYDLDWRWTAPKIQFRGELMDETVGSLKTDGYYADLSYHTLALPHTTWLARTEYINYAHVASWNSGAVTLGVRQVLTPHVSLELSQCWGNHSPLVDYNRGTALQLVTSTGL